MPDIRPDKSVVTQITTVKMRPDNQDDVLALMKERAKFMASQPGFVSVSLHRSEDGTHVVNYVQWTDKERLAAAHHSPEFRKKWPKFGELVQDVEPALYDVVLTEALIDIRRVAFAGCREMAMARPVCASMRGPRRPARP